EGEKLYTGWNGSAEKMHKVFNVYYTLTVTPAEDGYYLFTSQGIGQIDSTGRLVRLLGDDLVKQRTQDVR
ncbi:MAG: hypothetical protein P8Y94_08460, partial [Acidobacteriota bacterium]